MRLLLKMIVGTVLVAIVSVYLHNALLRWMEDAQIRISVEREARLIGRSVQTAIETALAGDHDAADHAQEIVETFDRIELIDSRINVMLFDRDGRLSFHSESSAFPDPGFAELLTDAERLQERGVFVIDHQSRPRRALLVLPIRADGTRIDGFLGLAEPLDHIESDLDQVRRISAWAFFALVMMHVLIGVFVGRTYIVEPLSRLRHALERVRAGEFDVALPERRRDEIGRLMAVTNDLARQLTESRRKLADEVESRRQLQLALQHMDKLASVGQLAAGLAHEVGSPLQVLSGRARSLARHADDPERVRSLSRILVQQSERLTRIMERMMHFARPPLPEARSCDLRPSIADVVELLQPEARRQGMRIRFESEPDAPRVFASVDQMQQVVFNLLTNALAWSEPGGEVVVRFGPPNALEREEYGSGFARLEVEDHGAGMDSETLAQAFDLFFTLRRAGGGSGLGLPVVKAIVEAHGGRVDAFSAAGRGTRLRALLPTTPPVDRPPSVRGDEQIQELNEEVA